MITDNLILILLSGALWVSVVLDPTKTLRRHPLSTELEKKRKSDFSTDENKRKRTNVLADTESNQHFLKSCLKNWSQAEVCPLEDPDIHWSATEIRENESQRHRHANSSNQFTSSNEETDDELEYQPNFSYNTSSRLELTTNMEVQEQQLSVVDGMKQESKSRKRKRLTKRANCKRIRKDYCKRFQRPRTIFHKAIDALKVSWADPQLLKILRVGEIPCK